MNNNLAFSFYFCYTFILHICRPDSSFDKMLLHTLSLFDTPEHTYHPHSASLLSASKPFLLPFAYSPHRFPTCIFKAKKNHRPLIHPQFTRFLIFSNLQTFKQISTISANIKERSQHTHHKRLSKSARSCKKFNLRRLCLHQSLNQFRLIHIVIIIFPNLLKFRNTNWNLIFESLFHLHAKYIFIIKQLPAFHNGKPGIQVSILFLFQIFFQIISI